jgi:predicted permease
MSWHQRPWKLVQRLLFFPSQAERDLDDEIRFHLAEEAHAQSECGLAADEAAAAARRAFGNVALAKEDTRAVWVSTRLEQLFQDLRFGSRILTRSPGISLTAVGLIALVIGGNATVFSIAHGVLTKPAPGVHASGLATVSWVADNGDIETHTEYRVYEHFVRLSTALQPIAAFDFARLTMTHDNGSYAVRGAVVSANYFDTLGVRLVKGRSFTADEATPGAADIAVVLAHHVWQNWFQGREDIVGRPLMLNGQPGVVVGVVEPSFRGAIFVEMADLWVPLTGDPRPRLRRNSGTDVAMIGRQSPDASLAEARAQLATLWAQQQRAHPELTQKYRVTLVPYSGTAGGNSIVATRGNRMLAVFSVVTALTIVIVCANVTNLLIARALVRQREMAVRQSLGASRRRIVRGLLAEGLVLSVVAWIAACLMAWWTSRAVMPFLAPDAAQPLQMPDLTPDWTVIGYALLLALACTIVVTVGPALRTGSQQLLPFLKVGEQGVVQGRSRLTHALVVVQLAFSILLLTSAGLARRSLSVRDSLDVGFDTRGILLATVNTSAGASAPSANLAILEALRTRLQRLPGVNQVSFVPGRRFSSWVDFPVRAATSDAPVLAVDNAVTSGYFATIGVPFVAGSDFTLLPRPAARSAIVNRHLAETLWPGETAIGKVLIGGPPEQPVRADVVGVVGDAFFSGRASEGPPKYVFFATAERPPGPGEATFLIRYNGGQEAIAPLIARDLREADARIPISSLRTFEAEISAEVAPLWILATLLTIFAGGSLAIAAIGQYAVVAFDGRRRTREFGLRIALGASPNQLIAAVMAESFRLTAVGIVAGFALSVGAGTLLARVLFGITPTDPPTYLGVFLLLAAASLLACYLPARRAARTDPLVALRTE